MTGNGGSRIPRGWLLAVGFLALLVGTFLIVRAFFPDPSSEDGPSSVANLTPRNIDGLVGGEVTEEYNQLIDEMNRTGALEAMSKGDSFVATPVGQKKEIEKKTEVKVLSAEKKSVVTMAPQPMAEPVKVKEQISAPAPAPDQDRIKALVGDLGKLGNPGPGAPVVTIGKDVEEPTETVATAVVEVFGPRLKIGEVLFAVTEMAVDSRVDAPVMSRVVGGKHKGLRFIGAFKQNNETLTLGFSRLIDPQLGSIGIEALAVNPSTDSPVMKAKVDRHLLARWGGLLASSFLEGLGEAMNGSGTTVSLNGDVVAVDKDKVDVGDAAVEAMGRVGSRAAGQLEKNFDRPPTVTMPSGSPIGILILDLKDIQ
jgi:hypothetical protein